MVIETTINVFLSLITKEQYVVKYFSALQTTFNLYINRFIIFTSIFVQQINFIIFFELFGLMTSILYEIEVLTTTFGRLTLVYTIEHYHKTVKDLCKALKDKFGAGNVSDVDKSRHVEDFMVHYMVATDNLDGTTNDMRTKMIAAAFCEFNKLIITVYYTNNIMILDLMKVITCVLELSLSVFSMAAPMILMESTANYLEEIKILLTDELLTYKVRNLCKILKCKLKTMNISDDEKSKHVQDFIVNYVKLNNNFAEVLKSTRPKMIVACVGDFFKLIFGMFLMSNQLYEAFDELLFGFLEIGLACTILFIPMLLLEHTANDVDKIKKLLSKELHGNDADSEKIQHIQDFVDGYIRTVNILDITTTYVRIK
ncbi:hypothetical protein HF086_014974, partial [Spodoptera exigua]